MTFNKQPKYDFYLLMFILILFSLLFFSNAQKVFASELITDVHPPRITKDMLPIEFAPYELSQLNVLILYNYLPNQSVGSTLYSQHIYHIFISTLDFRITDLQGSGSTSVYNVLIPGADSLTTRCTLINSYYSGTGSSIPADKVYGDFVEGGLSDNPLRFDSLLDSNINFSYGYKQGSYTSAIWDYTNIDLVYTSHGLNFNGSQLIAPSVDSDYALVDTTAPTPTPIPEEPSVPSIFDIRGMLEYLFVPSEDFDFITKEDLYAKFPFIEQLQTLYTTLFAQTFNTLQTGYAPPSFKINYEGVEFEIVDFSIYEPYRMVVHGIILCIAYITFILKVIRKLHIIVKGV